jgi:hypothetical protein
MYKLNRSFLFPHVWNGQWSINFIPYFSIFLNTLFLTLSLLCTHSPIYAPTNCCVY